MPSERMIGGLISMIEGKTCSNNAELHMPKIRTRLTFAQHECSSLYTRLIFSFEK